MIFVIRIKNKFPSLYFYLKITTHNLKYSKPSSNYWNMKTAQYWDDALQCFIYNYLLLLYKYVFCVCVCTSMCFCTHNSNCIKIIPDFGGLMVIASESGFNKNAYYWKIVNWGIIIPVIKAVSNYILPYSFILL